MNCNNCREWTPEENQERAKVEVAICRGEGSVNFNKHTHITDGCKTAWKPIDTSELVKSKEITH